MNKLFVLGSSGRLGTDFKKFVSKEEIVDWFIDDSKFLENNKFCFIKRDRDNNIDIGNHNSIFTPIDWAKKTFEPYTGIINFAALTDVDRFETDEQYYQDGLITNGYSLTNLIHICNQFQIPLIHISTDYVFDGGYYGIPHFYSERDITNPISKYGKSKLIAEELIQRYCKKYIILRISGLYGMSLPSSTTTFINKVAFAKVPVEIKACDDWYFTPTSTLEVYYGIMKLLEYSELTEHSNFWNEIYHLTSSKGFSKYEFYKYIMKKMPENPNITLTPTKFVDLKLPAQRPKDSRLNNNKFIRTFNALTLEEPKKFIQFMIKNTCDL